MKIFKFLSLLGLLMMCSCSDDNSNSKLELKENENLVFGTISPECTGNNCFTVFKLTKESVFKDNSPQFSQGNYVENQANLTTLSSNRFVIANDLLSNFPIFILNEERQIGSPGAADDPYYFIQLTRNGETKIIEISSFEDRIPSKYRPFLQKLKSVTNQLN